MPEYNNEDDIHRDIANQLVEATPEWWDRIHFKVTQTGMEGVGAIDSYEMSITNSDFPDDFVEPTEELLAATRALSQWYARQGQGWESVTYHLSQLLNGSWNFKVNFTYPRN